MSDHSLSGDIVLVVDDSPEALGFLTSAMEDEGVTVLVAKSGEMALDVVERVTPDVVLMDAVMPGLDGFETCRKLKQLQQVAHVPVIFMTALTETEHVIHALEAGGVDYLSKPINLDELRARIRVHLSNARRAQNAHVALDAAGRHLLAIPASGDVHWMTPQAARLLSAHESPGGVTQICMQLQDWLSQRADPVIGESVAVSPGEAINLQAIYLGAPGADEFLFRINPDAGGDQDAILRQHFALTQRESEVLLWIARGKANRDIGEILGLSPRTVNKHLEQVYTKLGVENRASAAIKAAYVLQSLMVV